MALLNGAASLTTIFVVTVAVNLAIWLYRGFRGPLSKLPGPWYSKWTSVVYQMKLIHGQEPLYVYSLHERYGRIVRVTPSYTSVQDVDAVRRMYSIKGEFLKSRFYEIVTVGSESVFSTTKVDIHRRHRRLLSSSLSESGLAQYASIVESKIRMTMQRIEEEAQQRGAANIFHWFVCMATDIIGELSFGSSFEMLETGKGNQYIEDLQVVGKTAGRLVAFPILYDLGRFFPMAKAFLGQGLSVRLLRYANEALQRHQKLVEEQGDDVKPTLLSKLYKAREDGLSFHELVSNARSYIIAGSDTTANTLTYLVWLVCKHEEIREKLLKEINSLPDTYSDKSLQALPYLSHVIDETLRLHAPVGSGLPRIVPSEGVQFCGHFVPGGSVVGAPAYSLHRDATIFQNPNKFDPSRWENPTQAMRDSFVPFGGGSRICIGLHLAKMELRLATVFFFRAFPDAQISNLDGFSDDDMTPLQYFLSTPKAHRCLIEFAKDQKKY